MVNKYLLPSFQRRNTIRQRHRSQGFCVPARPWAQAMEELKKNFENQVREVEEKLRREMKDMQSNHEQQVSILLKETQKMLKKITP